MRTRLGLVTATAAAWLACAALPAAALGGKLDQRQTASDYAGGIGAGQTLAQVFRAGISGKLDRADLLLSKVSSPTDPLHVQLRNTSSGAPGPTILASASISPASIGAELAFLPVMFAARPAVVAGRRYALIAYSADPSNNYGWGITHAPSVYARGNATHTSQSPPTGASIWTPDAGQDMAFKTYVAKSAACIKARRFRATAKRRLRAAIRRRNRSVSSAQRRHRNQIVRQRRAALRRATQRARTRCGP